MSLWRIVFRSLRQHAFSSTVTALSIALAGGLLMSVWSVRVQTHEAFTRINGGFDAVLGARSSKLQLVLNAVFHLEASPANLGWEDYEVIRKHAGVAQAIPIAMGDNYRGYRIVGTVPELFTEVAYAPGKRHALEGPGRWFKPGYKEAVVGSLAARRLKLRVGDHFHPYHGLDFDEEAEHEEDEYVVVGILRPSNTPTDRVLWIPLEGVQHMKGHAEGAASEISAVLVRFRSPVVGRALEMAYNKKDHRLTLAWPIGATMSELLDKVGWVERVLELVAGLVALVAAASVMASLYNSMNERRRHIALLRALGAHRSVVFRMILLESTTIAALGMLAAFGFLLLIMTGVSAVIRHETGVELSILDPHPVLWWAPAGMIFLGACAGVVPALKAYYTEVASNLAP